MNKKQYCKAKKKFFRRRVETWNLYYKDEEILQYCNGHYSNKYSSSKAVIKIVLDILQNYSHNYEAFFEAHRISCLYKNYRLKWGTLDRGHTFTFSV